MLFNELHWLRIIMRCNFLYDIFKTYIQHKLIIRAYPSYCAEHFVYVCKSKWLINTSYGMTLTSISDACSLFFSMPVIPVRISRIPWGRKYSFSNNSTEQCWFRCMYVHMFGYGWLYSVCVRSRRLLQQWEWLHIVWFSIVRLHIQV